MHATSSTTTSEKKIKNQIVNYLRNVLKAKVYCIQDRYTVGIPDIYCLYNGKSYWIEVKRDANAMRTRHAKRQIAELADLAHHGAIATMVSTLKEVKDVIRP